MHHDKCPAHPGTVPPHVAQGLKVLRSRIARAKIPPSKLDETLNVATWNVREFGKRPRTDAGIHYVAEVLGQFDLVALTELRDQLGDLDRVLPLLGPYWRVLYSDYNEEAAGNRERIAYLYDSRAVTPTGLVAELDPPKVKGPDGEYRTKMEWWRSPYMASFRAGDFDFILIAAHIRWGKNEKDRVVELQAMADWVDARVRSKGCEDHDVIVMGDFNVPSTDSALYKALTSRGLTAPKSLWGLKSNLDRTATYDQILHYTTYTDMYDDSGGVVDFHDGGAWRALFPEAEFKGMTELDYTFQMSDHLPLWIQIDTDTDDERLEQLAAPPKAARPRVTVRQKPAAGAGGVAGPAGTAGAPQPRRTR
jgi:endonuclease/exonuclease/phosphatase family metal-dependent hydrolase